MNLSYHHRKPPSYLTSNSLPNSLQSIKTRFPCSISHTTLLRFHLKAVLLPIPDTSRKSRKMLKQIVSLLPLLMIFLSFPTGFAQSPAQAPVAQPPAQAPVVQPPPKAPLAPGPAPSGPPNITAILEKPGQFSTLIRLLKTTNMDSVITSQLNDSSQGLTVFAPTDKAFAKLSAGSLNSYNNEKKARLLKLHLISSFLSQPEFQTVSNPVNTEAGSTGEYPLNVTVSGNDVKLTTGIVNTTVSSTIYSDGQLAVYQVDKVLLSSNFLGTPSPEPAPATSTASTSGSSSSSSSSSSSESASAPSKPDKADQPPPVSTADSSAQASGAMPEIHNALTAIPVAGFLIAALSLCL